MSASLEGGRLTRVAQRCWPRAELGHPGLPIILTAVFSRGGSSSHGKSRIRVRVVGIFLVGGISGLGVEYLLIGLGCFYLRVRCQVVFGVEVFQVAS